MADERRGCAAMERGKDISFNGLGIKNKPAAMVTGFFGSAKQGSRQRSKSSQYPLITFFSLFVKKLVVRIDSQRESAFAAQRLSNASEVGSVDC